MLEDDRKSGPGCWCFGAVRPAVKPLCCQLYAMQIPKDKRIVKIEDPEEIWIDHPNVTTIEARSANPGMSLQEITVAVWR